MKFTYEVKHNGVYYPAGADVPIENDKGRGESPAPLSSGKVDRESEIIQKRSDAVWADFDKKIASRKYSEEDLNLPYMKLKALAKANGFKVPNTLKADEIKEMLRGIV